MVTETVSPSTTTDACTVTPPAGTVACRVVKAWKAFLSGATAGKDLVVVPDLTVTPTGTSSLFAIDASIV